MSKSVLRRVDKDFAKELDNITDNLNLQFKKITGVDRKPISKVVASKVILKKLKPINPEVELRRKRYRLKI